MSIFLSHCLLTVLLLSISLFISMIHFLTKTCSFRSGWWSFSHVSVEIKKMFPQNSFFLIRNLLWGFHTVEVFLGTKQWVVPERVFFSRLQMLCNSLPAKTLPAESELTWLEQVTFVFRGKLYRIGHVFDSEDHDYGWYIIQK